MSYRGLFVEVKEKMGKVRSEGDGNGISGDRDKDFYKSYQREA